MSDQESPNEEDSPVPREENHKRKSLEANGEKESKRDKREKKEENSKSLKKRSRSRSGSRSGKMSGRSRYRSRSRSPRRRRRSRSGSYSPRRHRSRSGSHSPMSGRRRHTGNREDPQPNRCLGVFGLSIRTTEEELVNYFSKFGPVERVQVVIDAKTGRSRGFAFAYFESVEDAKIAKEQSAGMELDGRQIRVDFSITQRAHTPTPGIYMGKPTSYERDRGYGRGRDRYDDDYYGYRDRYRRTPSPHYRRRRYDRSRSRSYSPRRY